MNVTVMDNLLDEIGNTCESFHHRPMLNDQMLESLLISSALQEHQVVLTCTMVVAQIFTKYSVVFVVRRKDNKGGSSVEACSFIQRSYRGIPVQWSDC